MSDLRAYVLARAQERSTWLGLTSLLAAAGVAITPDQANTIVSLGLAVAGLVVAVTEDTLPPTALPLWVPALALGCGLAACTAREQAVLTVACQLDGVAQPILVPVVAGLSQGVAATDAALVHPAVVAACAAVKGVPVAVTP